MASTCTFKSTLITFVNYVLAVDLHFAVFADIIKDYVHGTTAVESLTAT